MTDSDEVLRNALRAADAKAARGSVPEFDDIWTAAEASAGRIRQRNRALAASLAAAAVVAVAVALLLPSEQEWRYIDTHELLETTYWSAPSDSLLPERQFDLYQDIPVLIESTEPLGGALL